MAKGSRRHCALGAMLAGLVLSACSVDISGVTFLRDEAFEKGGVGNTGGVVSKAGSSGKSGSGSGGASTGGSKQTAGTNAGGTNVGGTDTGGTDTGGTDTGGMGGMLPEVCPVESGDPALPLLDDLDDGDVGLPISAGRVGGWFVVGDDGGGTLIPEPSMPLEPDSPGFDTPYAMHMSGGGFEVWGATLGLALLAPFADRPPCPYDVSPHAGVRFMLKGMSSDAIVRFQMPTVATHPTELGGTCMLAQGCSDHYGIDLMVPSQWTEVEIDFADLSQVGWGEPFPLDLREVLNMEFRVRENTTFDIWIDDLRFY